MKQTSAIRLMLLITTSLLVSGCGLATSDEERLQRANEQMESGAYRAAVIELKNVLANDSTNIRARLMLAEVSLGLGDIDTAEKEMSRAAEYGAPEADIRRLNLRILSAKNSHSEILAALGTEAGGLSEVEQLQFRGQALLGLGNFDEAASTYTAWLAIEPDSADAAVGSALTMAAGGDTAAAIQQLESTISSHPSHVDALHALASVYAVQSDFAAAEEALLLVVARSDPQTDIRRYVKVLSELINAQLQLGKNDDARHNLERLSAIAPQTPMSLLLAARLARAEQDYALAARHLQQLLNISPNHLPTQLFLANVQMMQGNFAQAEVLLNRIVSISPGNIMARKLLAEAQVRQAQPQGAMEVLAPLLESSAEDADIYKLLAQISMQQGDPAAVVRNLQAAVEASPDDTSMRLNLVAAYLEIGESEKAAEVLADVPKFVDDGFRRQQLQLAVFRANKRMADADIYIATLLDQYAGNSSVAQIVSSHFVAAGNRDLGKQILIDHVGQYGADTAVLLALGRLDLDEGNLDLAATRFQEVLQEDARNLYATIGLARLAELGGDMEKVAELLEDAAAAHPDALAPKVLLANLYLSNDRLEDAEAMANDLTAMGFSHAGVSEIVGSVFIAAGRVQEAITQFEQAAKLDPRSPSIQMKLARAFAAADRNEDARSALGNALRLQPGWVPAKIMLALVELRQGQTAAAMQHATELRQANPEDLSAMVLEGEIHFYQKDFEKAAAAFERAVKSGAGRGAVVREFQARLAGEQQNPETSLEAWLASEPEDTFVRTILAQYYLQSQNGEKAVREFETVITTLPDNAAMLNNLAWQYQQLGRLDEALEVATKAFELQSESGAIADTLGWIYRDLGDLEKSHELLAAATRMSPDNAEISFHLAAVLAEMGEKNRAREIIEHLIDEEKDFPSRDDARKLLSEL